MKQVWLRDYGLLPDTGTDCTAALLKRFRRIPGIRNFAWSRDDMISGLRRRCCRIITCQTVIYAIPGIYL